MKNREVLAAPRSALHSLDRQRQFLLRIMTTPVRCPNDGCSKPINQFEAMGVDIDAYDFANPRDDDDSFQCPHCRYKLRRVVPFILTGTAGYYFEINEPLPVKQ